MTVIENLNPKVQYTYTVGHQFYTITFPYIEREYVKVMVRDQLLTYNVHYGVPSFDAESLDTNQLQIELYITPEEELDDDITIEAGDTITIYRATPLDQQQEFPQNAKFSSQKITEALDKLTHQQQEQEVTLGQCFKVAKNVSSEINLTLPEPAPKQFLAWNEDGTSIINDDTSAEKWATYMDGPVEGDNYSAKYYSVTTEQNITNFLEEGAVIIGKAEEQAEIAEAYAERAEFGMQWTAFTEQNWVIASDGIHYELNLSSLPMTLAVYSGTWNEKKLAAGVNIITSGEGVKLYSIDAFDGYALSCSSIIGNYVHEQDLASDEWVINHNLGHIPCITVLDSNNEEPVCGKKHNSFNQCVITFTEPKTGKAYLR